MQRSDVTGSVGRGERDALATADAPAGQEGLADPTGPSGLADAVAAEWALDDAGALDWDRLYIQLQGGPPRRRREPKPKPKPPAGSRGALPPGAVWMILAAAPGGTRHGENLSHGAGGVLAILAFRSDATGYCWQGVPALARRARVAPRTVWRALGGRTPERRETGLGGAGALAYVRRGASKVVDVQLNLRGRDTRDGLSAKTANRTLDAAQRVDGLPGGTGCVLAVMLALSDGRGSLRGVDVPTIAEWASVSERQTKRCTSALVKAELLHRERARRESIYQISSVA
jgi:hypothetical protein